jgi:hypothetical protein
MKASYVFLILMTAVSVLLVGCSKQEPTPEVVAAPAGDAPGPRGELQGTTRLALAILKLEGTENALTPAQASELVPLWTIIQGGSLQGQAETDAVLRQIESKMTEPQRAAVDAMDLTFQDIGAWMQEQGVEMPTPDASSGRPAGQAVPGPGGPGAFQNMSEEDRTRLREEFQNMTQEQRATRMAEMGFQRPEGGGQGGFQGAPGAAGARGGFGGRAGGNLLLEPLIELLTKRAAG